MSDSMSEDASLAPRTKRTLTLDEAARLSEKLKADGLSVGLCHGVFDLLHPGHLRHFAAARRAADVLFVSLTADAFVNKGPGRPAFPDLLRAEALESLRHVDYVVVSPEPTALTVLEAIRPTAYFKGQDYAEIESDPTGNMKREQKVVEEHGGRVVFTDEIVFSSSSLINQFVPRHSKDAQAWLAAHRDVVNVDMVMFYLDRISDVKVTVVGESIIDAYTTCEALGKASKEPVLCMRLGDTTSQAGGALAVAGHVRGLGATVDLVTGLHSDSVSSREVTLLKEGGTSIHAALTDPAPTIRKWRIVDEQTQARVIELYEMDDSPVAGSVEADLRKKIKMCMRRSDVVIVTDYGHGLLSDHTINDICATSAFLAVNAQANAGNHGLNSLRKYGRADFATLNGGEIRLDARRRHIELDDYAPAVLERLRAKGLLVTQGASGTYLRLDDGSAHRAPALAPFVADRVGAGDTVLSITAPLMYLRAPAPVVGFLGNLVGAWSVAFLGNEKTLDIGTLKRQVSSILK